MKRFFIVITLMLAYQFTQAQTIINVERLTSATDSTVYALALSYSGTRGNSHTDQISIAPAMVILKSKQEFKIFGGYDALSSSGSGILNSGFIHLRHNYKISKRLKTFAFYQWQFNDVLLINSRRVFGGGLRWNLVKKDSLTLDTELGLMDEKEVLDKMALKPFDIVESNKLRLTYVNSLKWTIGKLVKINNVVYYQPDLSQFSDFRVLNDFNLVVTVSHHLDLITSITTRYDSKPPSVLKHIDNTLSFGFNIKFSK